MRFFFGKQQAGPDEKAALLEALADTRDDLEAARSAFAWVREPELVEALIYELGALEARYGYLLHELRAAGITAGPRFRPALPGRR